MAELAGVYDATPDPRTPSDVISRPGQPGPARPCPHARGKWLTASITDDIPAVITAAFDEAHRRDPDHRRPWVALVDGNTTQIEDIQAETARRQVSVTIVLDFIHVLEYLSAPRGARLYPLPSGERLEEHLWIQWLTWTRKR